VPLPQAKEMVFSARTMSGEEALAAGLVNKNFDNPELLQKVRVARTNDI